MSELIKIFIAFLIPGVVGYGGGPASMAIINSTVVDMFGLISQNDMNVVISFSNALPGPIATLLALGVGYFAGGIVGGIVALIAIVVPSCIVIVVLYNFLMKRKDDYRVKRISKYIIPLIIVLFIQITLNFIIQSFVSLNNIYATIGIILVSAIAIIKLKVHPAFLIFGSMIFGYFIL